MTQAGDIIQKVILYYEAFGDENIVASLKKAEKSIAGMKGRITLLTNELSKLKKTKQMTEMETAFRTMRHESLSLGLSLLFTGMAVKRFADVIIKSALDAFNKVVNSSGEVITATSMLAASFEVLKFALGDAINTVLEALLPALMPILEALTDWITKNPKLAAGILVVTSFTGALAMSLGQALLLVAGTSGTGGLIGAIKTLTPLLAPIGTAIAGLGLWGLIAVLFVVVAAVAILKAAWDSDFAGIQETTKSTMDSVITTLQGSFTTLGTIWTAFVGVFNSGFKGNTQDMYNNILLLGATIVALGLKLFMGLESIVISFLTWVLKGAISLAGTMLQVAIDAALAVRNAILDITKGIYETLLKVANAIAPQFVEPIQSALDNIKKVKAESADAADYLKGALKTYTEVQLKGADAMELTVKDLLGIKDLELAFLALDEKIAKDFGLDSLTTATDDLTSAIKETPTTAGGVSNTINNNQQISNNIVVNVTTSTGSSVNTGNDIAQTIQDTFNKNGLGGISNVSQ